MISATFLAMGALWGQFELAPGGNSSPASEARMVAEVSAIAPGKPFRVALELKHPPGWHSYYLNSGGMEMPPEITWKLPEGFEAGPILWPVPEVKDGYFGKSFIHSGRPVFLTEIRPPATLPSGAEVSLEAEALWQICEESCINEEGRFVLTLGVAAEAVVDGAQAELFARADAARPAEAAGWKIEAEGHASGVRLRVWPPAGLTDPGIADFVPDVPFLEPLSAGGSLERDGEAWVLHLKRRLTDALDEKIEQGDRFSGILLASTPVAVPVTEIGVAAAPPAKAASLPRMLAILYGMLLGGLILNLMPCVFPVIGLKIMGSVQQAGQDRRKVALHGVAFTVGVLASFAVLSGILFAARSVLGSDALNWGYQLQVPWVVLGLLLLLFVLGLNMYGVFEIGASATSVGGKLQAKQGLAGSFFSGVLATVVATPCSAPFLGVAIGAAIVLPAYQFFMAFGAMALGLALPYLVLSIFPALTNLLPRPGAWMESFKQGMSFLLFATAGYLLWVYFGLIDLDNGLGPIFGLSAVAVAAWIYGRWHLPYRSARARGIALMLTVLFAVVGVFLAKPPTPAILEWEPWTEEREQELLAEGRPVFIDFTAKWCATCQVNKKRAYSAEVVAQMKRKGVVALKADKTKANPAIEARLAAYGRSAIPVNVLLVPDADPLITPELLTPGYLLEIFEAIPERN